MMTAVSVHILVNASFLTLMYDLRTGTMEDLQIADSEETVALVVPEATVHTSARAHQITVPHRQTTVHRTMDSQTIHPHPNMYTAVNGVCRGCGCKGHFWHVCRTMARTQRWPARPH